MKIINKVAKKLEKSRPIYVNNYFQTDQSLFLNKRAIVIGGGTGIGREIALSLCSCGCDVIVVGRREHHVKGCKFEKRDVTEIETTAAWIEEMVKRYGRIDILVNSQGVLPEADRVMDMKSVTSDSFDQVFHTNVKSVYFLCKEMCLYFETNGIEGHILNIASTEALRGSQLPYGMSKASIICLTKGLGRDVADKGITVNGIAPGGTATTMIQLEPEGDLRRALPSNRVTTPVEIAQLALVLLSDVGRQMCGQTVVMDGGESL